MNFLPEKKYGVPSHNFVKKMFCAKKVKKLPDLTEVNWVLNMCCMSQIVRLWYVYICTWASRADKKQKFKIVSLT
jgi:hypothetical protein